MKNILAILFCISSHFVYSQDVFKYDHTKAILKANKVNWQEVKYETQVNVHKPSYTQATMTHSSSSYIDTLANYKNKKIAYEPSRLVYWIQTPTTLGIQQDFRVVKNVLNIGTATDHFFTSGYTQTLYSAYLSPYLAINRMRGQYKKQDNGLFINAKIGYSSLSSSVEGIQSSVGGLMTGLGADYFISKGLGVNISLYKFKDAEMKFQSGICLRIF